MSYTLNTTAPLDTDLKSVYPALERTFRAALANGLSVEHDIVGASTAFTGHHKFGVGSTATRDGTTDWVVGSLWFNNTPSPPVLELCTSVGPVVWTDVTAGGGTSYDTAWADVATNTTVDLGAQTTRNIHLTGTTTIASFGATATSGQHFFCRANAAFQLTYDATAMVLPTAANITTAAGDTFEVIALGSGNFVVFNYTRASGFALATTAVKTVKRQTFTSSGTYTPSAGMLYCTVRLQAPGGGSGGTPATASNNVTVSGGGGSGGFAEKVFTAATIGASQVVTIGAVGAAGSSGPGAGGTGGTTSLGALLSATGGAGGAAGPTAGTLNGKAVGGAGGVGSSGDLNINGNQGGLGFYITGGGTGSIAALGGNGAASPVFGGGQTGPYANGTLGVVVGAAGNNYGAGASGNAVSQGSAAAHVGFAGGPGIIDIIEYCSQ